MTPTHQTMNSAGADVACAETVTIEPKSYALVKTGAYLPDDIPDRHFAMLVPRSSLFMKTGLMQRSNYPLTWHNIEPSEEDLTQCNGVGIIDADYKDEILMPLYNITDEPVTVMEGDRIGQLVTMEYKQVYPVKQSERNGGFGSSGK